MRRFVRSFVLAAALVGCADVAPNVGLAVEGVVGGAPLTGVGRATGTVTGTRERCTATLIAEDWVITAAHCGPGASSTFGYTPPTGGPVFTTTRTVNGCYAHPDVVMAPAPGFGACPVIENRRSINLDRDVLLLHLAAPVDQAPHRPLRAPHACLARGTTFEALVRGFGDVAPSFDVAELRRPVTIGDDLSPALDMVLLPGAGMGSIGPGDSGGPITYRASDDYGPVLAVASSAVHFTGIWSDTVNDWIWETLDGQGACSIGSTSPCVFREATPPGGDVCGDGHCTGAERRGSCGESTDDCSTAWPDSDADGLPDIRDFCPRLDARFVTPERLNDAGTNHRDDDGDFMGDDCEPTACRGSCGFDDDYDGIQNECDNCPTLANEDQADCDGVGRGDACDLGGNDADGDRSPDQCDNCPQPNPDQRNCNFEAEEAAGITHTPGNMGLGDVCDPAPCPGGTMGIVAREYVRFDPFVPPVTVATSAAFAGTGRQTSADGSYDTPTGIRTSFRWCPCADASSDDNNSRVTCRGTSQCEIDFARLDEAPGLSWGWRVPSVQYPGTGSAGLDPSASPSPYGACVGRDVTLRPAQCIATYNPRAPLPRDVVEWEDHFRGSRPLSFVAYWDFESDARAVGALTEGAGGSRFTQGVYWYRANEYEGKPAFVALLPSNSCNRVGGCPTAGAAGEFTFSSDLTSHYSSGRIDSIPTGPVARPLGFLGWWLASRAACATCASSFPRPPLTQVRCPSPACASPEIFGRLNGVRELALAPRFTGQALTALREPGALFVHASEVADERSESAVPFVTVDEATLALRTVFTDAFGSLGLFQGQGGPNEPLAALRGASPEMASGGACPLLEGATGTLYRIGGLESETPRAHFERLRLATGAVSRVGILGAAPEEVLAVTLDSGRHEAIVLDRVGGGRRGRAHERVRILRLDLESGRSQVIASTRGFRAFTNHYLAQAPGGTFVLAVSRRGRSSGYRLVHFTLPVEPGPVTVMGSYVAHGRNLEGPIVAESMGVNVAETGSPWRPVGVRWLDFRERRDRGSDFDDCF